MQRLSLKNRLTSLFIFAYDFFIWQEIMWYLLRSRSSLLCINNIGQSVVMTYAIHGIPEILFTVSLFIEIKNGCGWEGGGVTLWELLVSLSLNSSQNVFTHIQEIIHIWFWHLGYKKTGLLWYETQVILLQIQSPIRCLNGIMIALNQCKMMLEF